MKPLHMIAWDWGVRCFGRRHMEDCPLRSLRLLEEVAEYAQAVNVPRETALKVINAVYDRPVGDALQELGGIMVTANMLCISNHREPEDVYAAEIRRVLVKSPEHFARRNQDKLDLGLG